MKKIVALSIMVAFGSTAMAQEVQNVPSNYADKFTQAIKGVSQKQAVTAPAPTTQPANTASTDNSSDKAVTDSNKDTTPEKTAENTSQPQEVKAEKKPIKKVKKAKPAELSVESTKVLVSTTQEIPSNISLEEVGKFLSPIKDSDISVQVVDTSDKKLTYNLIDNRSGSPIKAGLLQNPMIQGLAVDSDLTNLKYTSNIYDANSANYISLNGVGDCQAAYLTYQLKGQSDVSTKTVFLDRLSNSLGSEKPSCKFANLDANETTFYTKSGYIINAGFDKKKSSNGQIGVTIHMSKDGRPFSSHDTVVYAISKDFKTAIPLTVKHDSRGTFFGSSVEKSVNKGTYYIVIGFSYESKYEWVSTITSVN